MSLRCAPFVAFCLLGTTGLLSCQSDSVRGSAREPVAGEPTRVDAYTVDKSEALPSKEWQVYDLNGDTVCLPIAWRHRVSGETFTAAHPAETDSLVKFTFSRYLRLGMTPSVPAYARQRFQRRAGLAGPPVVKRFTFQRGVLYGTDTVVVRHGRPYAAHCVLYVTGDLAYAMDLVVPAEATTRYPNDLFNNIIMNTKLNAFCIFDNDNPLLKVMTLK
jgi:hypothetical protein